MAAARTGQPPAAGRTLFDRADELGFTVASSCGRTGRCHECVVEVRDGMAALGERTEAEAFLRGDYRLACQSVIEGQEGEIDFEPLRRASRILTETRVKPELRLDPVATRQGDEVLYDADVVDRYRGHIFGLAVDLGTTTVALELVDLETGRTLATRAFENPQTFGGSDIMGRISYEAEVGQGALRKAVVGVLNQTIQGLAREHGFHRREIYEITVAGNSTMRDILFGVDVQPIGQKPYKSRIELAYLAGRRERTSLLAETRELGLVAGRRTKVYGLPLVASHVGADAAADLAALDFALEIDDGGARMLIDIGTNTEVVIGRGGHLIAASCPAGPAFEGGLVSYGMAAADGAVERLSLDCRGRVEQCSVIGDATPVGLCGSALVDALAELRRGGLMTEKGVFTADRKLGEIALFPDLAITLSKQDIGNLGQAKAANYCGQFILLRALGIDPGALERVYLAGGFANYIDVENAIRIGLLAPVAPERVERIGNAALQGAREVLLSRTKRARLEALVRRIEHVELETTDDFFEIFVDGCQFKPMPAVLDGTGASARQGAKPGGE